MHTKHKDAILVHNTKHTFRCRYWLPWEECSQWQFFQDMLKLNIKRYIIMFAFIISNLGSITLAPQPPQSRVGWHSNIPCLAYLSKKNITHSIQTNGYSLTVVMTMFASAGANSIGRVKIYNSFHMQWRSLINHVAEQSFLSCNQKKYCRIK